jgi:hypothetical protein
MIVAAHTAIFLFLSALMNFINSQRQIKKVGIPIISKKKYTSTLTPKIVGIYSEIVIFSLDYDVCKKVPCPPSFALSASALPEAGSFSADWRELPVRRPHILLFSLQRITFTFSKYNYISRCSSFFQSFRKMFRSLSRS